MILDLLRSRDNDANVRGRRMHVSVFVDDRPPHVKPRPYAVPQHRDSSAMRRSEYSPHERIGHSARSEELADKIFGRPAARREPPLVLKPEDEVIELTPDMEVKPKKRRKKKTGAQAAQRAIAPEPGWRGTKTREGGDFGPNESRDPKRRKADLM